MMKKLLVILALCLLFSGSVYADQSGRTELKLSNFVVENFIRYIKGNASKSPSKFAVSKDGKGYTFTYCNAGATCSGGDALLLEVCSKRSNGVECFLFARKRTIKWKNGINPGKGKTSKISRKWSDAEIKTKLTELGFLGGSTTSNSATTKKIEKKKESSSDEDIVKKLKDLKELLNSGALSKKEFEKAKKKILN
jgi:hypothetical protein